MSFARVLDDAIATTGFPPDLLPPEDPTAGDRWWDLRQHDQDFATWESDILAPHGWMLIATTTRPPDTPTTTFDYSVALVDGVPTEVWTERPWTQAELAAVETQANQSEMRTDSNQAVDQLVAVVNELNVIAENSLVDPMVRELAVLLRTVTRQVNREARQTANRTDDNYTGRTVWIKPRSTT